MRINPRGQKASAITGDLWEVITGNSFKSTLITLPKGD